MPSGKRVAIEGPALLQTTRGESVDILASHPADGFSHGTQILALLNGAIDGANLITADRDPILSLEPDSPTVLLEASSAERVLHLSELDVRADDDARRGLVIRPLVRLRNETRYVVAIRSLRDRNGQLVPAPIGFAQIRDGQAADHPALAALAARYDTELFPVLERAGIVRSELQLAWDFTTESQQNVAGDMLTIRKDILAEFSETAPEIQIEAVVDQVDPHIHRQIDGIVKVPLYLENTKLGAALHRDWTGQVVANGWADVPFTVIIPPSVAQRLPGSPQARLLQFGHGFFGSRDEVFSFLATFADTYEFVVVAADWWGMTKPDGIEVIDALSSNINETLRFTDRVHQAMANFIALAYAAQGPLVSRSEMQFDDGPLYSDGQTYFYGISQGAILGGTYAALSPNVERATLGVGGAGFSLIMFRSLPFMPFLAFIATQIEDPLDQQKFALLTQTTFDRIDPLTYAPHVLTEPYTSSPADRRVLLQIGVGDAQVPNLAAHSYARSLGVLHLQPPPRAIVGLTTAPSPVDGSAIAEFDFGVDPLPGITPTPGDSNEVHDSLRLLEAGQQQIDAFFQPTGMIENTCSGVCDPE